MSKLLINEPPLLVLRSLAISIGLNEAIFLQQLHYLLNISKNEKDGRKWVYKTYEKWVEDEFPFWCVGTVRNIFRSLKKKGILLSFNYNKAKFDKTLWYSIDYDALEKLANNNNSDNQTFNNRSDEINDSICQNLADRSDERSRPIEQKLTNQYHKNNINNINNIITSNNIISSRRRKKATDEKDLRLAKEMFIRIKQVCIFAKEPNLDTWANDIRLMRERDGLTRNDIWAVFSWANNDQFWQGNILSPRKLREKFTQLIIKMKNQKTAKLNDNLIKRIKEVNLLASDAFDDIL